MILYALSRLYERLASDPASGIAAFGFSEQKIAYCVVLNLDGTLVEIEDTRRAAGKNLVPVGMIVPGGAKPSGSGINPNFLWDNLAYMLGFKPDDPKAERTAATFEAFRAKHAALEAEISDPVFSAVCRFLNHWKPADAAKYSFLMDLVSGFGVFRIRGRQQYVHDSPSVVDYWRHQLVVPDGAAGVSGQCLVTGESSTIARLHQPLIKGVAGAQSSGAAIVSFNCDAFESYGKEQSLNSPVGETATFQYATALNYLLRSGSKQRVQIGDATVVFWTDAPTAAESFFGFVFDATGAEDEEAKSRLGTILSRIASGEHPTELGDPQTPFYILGLSANAARISVRFWYQSTLGDVIARIGAHYRDLELGRSARDPQFPEPWRLLRETARESKDIPPLLSGALLRAILNETIYPDALFSAVIRRIRADRQVGYVRAAVLKASINRKSRLQNGSTSQEIPVSLDPNRAEPAYHMGRLFAELEKTQEDALPTLNDTIKDRFFGAASATPAAVFPRLMRLSQHHLGKLERGNKIYHERRIQDICEKIDAFAPHLGLKDQGLFAIGYYHQRHDIFTKKSSPAPTRDEE